MTEGVGPPAKRARAQAPHERALELLTTELNAGRSMEEAVGAVTVGDDALRDVAMQLVRSTPALSEDPSVLAALLADAPRARGVGLEPPAVVPSPQLAKHAGDDGAAARTRVPKRTVALDVVAEDERAMYTALLAGVRRGLSVEGAVSAALGSRARLTAPVHDALRQAPGLQDDLRSVATLCAAVAEAARTPRRPRLQLALSGVRDVAGLVGRARNIVVLAGAGVSVSCGIPDFRSAGGMYDRLARDHGLADPQAVFDLREFRLDPSLFYAFAREVMPRSDVAPSHTHRFIAELARRGTLRRCYTQNIDGLEVRAGVPSDLLVAAHGSFSTATCQRCYAKYQLNEYAKTVTAGNIPTCDRCRKGGGDDDEDDENDDGNEARARAVLKPDIVFFGERLPDRVDRCLNEDLHKADLILVLGTSLMVAPVARIPSFFPPHLPRVLVNRELVDYRFDVELLGDCDVVVEKLRTLVGWKQHPSPEDPEADAVTFVQPRRFLFKGTKVTADDAVEEDDTISLLDLLPSEADSDSEEGETDDKDPPQQEQDTDDEEEDETLGQDTVDESGGDLKHSVEGLQDVERELPRLDDDDDDNDAQHTGSTEDGSRAE